MKNLRVKLAFLSIDCEILSVYEMHYEIDWVNIILAVI